jgi:type I restriction enzyme, S subunit
VKTGKWGDLCELRYGKALRDYPEEPSDGDRVRVYGTNGPIGWTTRPLCDHAGIIIGRKGAYRGVHYSADPFFVIDTAYYCEPTSDDINMKWAYYKLLTVDINRMDVGAAIPTTNRDEFYALEVRYPDLRAQEKTAEILSAYDDLIENNRRRMALLEEAARQLYREWFVRLRFPGHEHTRIIDGLPEGWFRRSLGELADFRLGKMLDQNKNKGDLMPYLANVNVRWGEIDLQGLREMRFEEDEIDAFGLRFGDIVMCEGGEPGRCAIWKEQLPQMMIQKAIHRIRAYPHVSCLFLYLSLRHQGQSGQIATLFTGATIKHLPREKLALVAIVTPPEPLMKRFAEQVDPLERQIAILEAANRRASQARDLLLPRLMGGEIAV